MFTAEWLAALACSAKKKLFYNKTPSHTRERERFLEANKKCGTHSGLGSAACRLPAEAGVGTVAEMVVGTVGTVAEMVFEGVEYVTSRPCAVPSQKERKKARGQGRDGRTVPSVVRGTILKKILCERADFVRGLAQTRACRGGAVRPSKFRAGA